MLCHIIGSLKRTLEVEELASALEVRGHNPTFRWWEDTRPCEMLTEPDLRMLAKRCARGVVCADFVVGILPFGRAGHVELGIARGLEIKTFLWSPDGDAFRTGESASIFYHAEDITLLGAREFSPVTIAKQVHARLYR